MKALALFVTLDNQENLQDGGAISNQEVACSTSFYSSADHTGTMSPTYLVTGVRYMRLVCRLQYDSSLPNFKPFNRPPSHLKYAYNGFPWHTGSSKHLENEQHTTK